jgi:tRNA (guanine-N7-)-methyltransferase
MAADRAAMSVFNMSVSDDKKMQRGAFFGRRKGHALRPHQAALMQTLLPKLAIELGTPAPHDLAELFPVPVDDVRLEIGFGGGEHMIAQAQARPRTGFIGVEQFVNGMAKALAAIEATQLANIRLHFGDATFLLDWLPAASLARVDLIYPDPWPKRRHWKRRFVQDATVAMMARVLKPGSIFRFATDVADYAEWTSLRLMRSGAFVPATAPADEGAWADFAGTRYEAKARRVGSALHHLAFRRSDRTVG